ncbi:MAG: hypothetical protein HN742_29200 [Lentisphaerae bacterium]|nr:hypothetical protein [Lentisphaerota bacterium]MBT4821803.1 hypothetical protein [Lentisphaerota bacterium]MBT5611015.1 hypothetical protein [Lentisphaerota bacterium]MBT7059352.1 hypothetical protein [Lentisphaerota bacterium]MBT7845985.1 hypothetical protein [Lentisphaerota bacterium]
MWAVDSQEDWESHRAAAENAEIKEGALYPTQRTATFQSTIKRYAAKRQAASLTVRQSDLWQNWNPCPNIGPTRLGDSPVLLSLGPQDYWIMGRCQVRPKKPEETVELPGYDAPLLRTAKPNEFIAPGGLEPHAGGYQAWHSRDMKNWVYYGSVTEKFSTWVTNAEYVDGKFYIYYDFPNDQDPHLYIDSDLTDGKPGKNMGLALADPSHGSDCTVIRDKGGSFHIVYEDWSPIFANRRSFDSPLAGHAVSPDGIKDFKILPPAVDERTTPTGVIKTYKHPHWVKEDPKRFTSDIGEYEVHTPEQYAYGDWAAICVGSQYYLFGDFDPPPGKHPKSKDGKGSRGSHMSVGWFTSESLDKQFRFCDKIGSGHPDPDICFAEDQFYLATQQRTDYTSPGPWVESVEVRVGVDTSNDGRIDRWTPWQEIKETYDYTPGFAKHVKRLPARLDLAALPPGYGFQFELKMTDTTENRSNPIVDHVSVTFE